MVLSGLEEHQMDRLAGLGSAGFSPLVGIAISVRRTGWRKLSNLDRGWNNGLVKHKAGDM